MISRAFSVKAQDGLDQGLGGMSWGIRSALVTCPVRCSSCRLSTRV